MQDDITANTGAREKKKKTNKKRKTVSKNRGKPAPNNAEEDESSPAFLPRLPLCGAPRDQLLLAPPCCRTEEAKDAGGAGRKSRKKAKDPPAASAETDKCSAGSPPPRCPGATELSAEARESLRWEAALGDPFAEEKRLELYRANRRQRYRAQKQALLEESRAVWGQAAAYRQEICRTAAKTPNKGHF